MRFVDYTSPNDQNMEIASSLVAVHFCLQSLYDRQLNVLVGESSHTVNQ